MLDDALRQLLLAMSLKVRMMWGSPSEERARRYRERICCCAPISFRVDCAERYERSDAALVQLI